MELAAKPGNAARRSNRPIHILHGSARRTAEDLLVGRIDKIEFDPEEYLIFDEMLSKLNKHLSSLRWAPMRLEHFKKRTREAGSNAAARLETRTQAALPIDHHGL